MLPTALLFMFFEISAYSVATISSLSGTLKSSKRITALCYVLRREVQKYLGEEGPRSSRKKSPIETARQSVDLAF